MQRPLPRKSQTVASFNRRPLKRPPWREFRREVLHDWVVVVPSLVLHGPTTLVVVALPDLLPPPL